MTFHAARYPADWKAIRKGIVLRANNACERCRAPNGALIARHVDRKSYMLDHGDVFDAETGAHLGVARGSEYDADKFVVVVLTVAHLDHDESNNDDTNLSALCQRCHLNHDRTDNNRRRRVNVRAAEDEAAGQGNLFATRRP